MDRPYSLYDVLNVSPGAAVAAIEASYRALMKKHHPDQAGPAAAGKAAEINAAFSILRDPERRATYDRHEQARQRALIATQMGKVKRRRFLGWAGWGASAALVFAATAVAADRYGGALVRPAKPVAAEGKAAEKQRPFDPGALITEVLAETRKLTLAPRPAPPRAAPAAAEPAPRLAPPPSPPRRASEPAPREDAAGDFLERHDHIY